MDSVDTANRFFKDPNELVKFLEQLNSDEYQCPGGHYSRKLTYQEEDANRSHWCYDEDGRQTWVQPRLPEGVTYVLEGTCKERLTITLETEWEEWGGTLYSYLIAKGPCAEALGLPDDDDYSHPLWARVSERRQIRALAEGRLEWTTS